MLTGPASQAANVPTKACPATDYDRQEGHVFHASHTVRAPVSAQPAVRKELRLGCEQGMGGEEGTGEEGGGAGECDSGRAGEARPRAREGEREREVPTSTVRKGLVHRQQGNVWGRSKLRQRKQKVSSDIGRRARLALQP